MTEKNTSEPSGNTPEPQQEQSAMNTDRDLWREPPGDFYANRLFLTEGGGIGMDVGGWCIVKLIKDWHKLAAERVAASSKEAQTTINSSDMKMEKACARKWLEANSEGLNSERQFETAVDALAVHIFHYIVGWDDEVDEIGAEATPSPATKETPPLSLHGLQSYIGDEDHPITSGTFFGIQRSVAPSPAREETPPRSELFTVEREDGEWVASNEADYSCYLSRAEAEEALSSDADNCEVNEELYKIIRFVRDTGARSVVVAPQTEFCGKPVFRWAGCKVPSQCMLQPGHIGSCDPWNYINVAALPSEEETKEKG